MTNNRRLSFIIGTLICFIVALSRCVQQPGVSPSGTGDPRGAGYTGMAACVGCHKSIGSSYLHAAHALTSRIADMHTVAGPFQAPGNEFVYGPGRKVMMQQRDSGLYQVAVTSYGEEAHRFDIAVGSGRKAQTYLYWKGDGVFQLPVSYFLTERSWANSPHYPVDSIWFGRAVDVGCFQCHASYIGAKRMIHTDAFHGTPQYDRDRVVYGIDCERCHGPGALHAAWQAAHPEDTTARYMARFALLGRQQRLDVCAQCHSGGHPGQIRSVFYFKPGDALTNYFFADPRGEKAPDKMDVHGNQYALLAASKCFLQSKTLECGTCHNTHVKERDNPAVFATRCMSCHGGGNVHAGGAGGSGVDGDAPFCGLAAKVDKKFLINNCIDCHMPARASTGITMLTREQKDPVADLVRSHYITIYPEETKKLLGTFPEGTKKRLAMGQSH